MEKKIQDLKHFMKAEREKQFRGTTTRFEATERGPIRNYGAHIINKHMNPEDKKTKTFYNTKNASNTNDKGNNRVFQRNSNFDSDVMNSSDMTDKSIDKSFSSNQNKSTGTIVLDRMPAEMQIHAMTGNPQ